MGTKVSGAAMTFCEGGDELTGFQKMAVVDQGVKQPLPSLNVGGGNVQNGQLGGDPEAGHGGGGHYHHEGSKSGWSVPVSRETVHRVGQDSWWEVGFHFIAALNNAFILGYPALIMAYLGFATGSLCLIGGGVISFYNNCLLGSLHETGGKRHIRYRDLAGHIYGRGMYRATWFVQYFNLSIANVGTIILAGEALKVLTSRTMKAQ